MDRLFDKKRIVNLQIATKVTKSPFLYFETISIGKEDFRYLIL